jgi:hypothetical protein
VRDILAECGFTAHIQARGEEAQALKENAGQSARRGGGWCGRLRGCTAFGASWSAGTKSRSMIWPSCILPVPSSPSVQ